MLAVIDVLRAPSEHSELLQNCNDDGGNRAVVERDAIYLQCPCDIVSKSFLLRSLGTTGGRSRRQVQSMRGTASNTLKFNFSLLLFAFSGMNKHTYTTCIKDFEVPYRVMFIHLSTSTSIRATDQLQQN